MKRRGLCIFLCMISICSLFMPQVFVYASQEEQVIRVGVPTCTGYHEVDEEGNHTGYLIAYLKEVAKYTGWEYEIVSEDEHTSKEDLRAQLQNGDLDMVIGMVASEANTETFLFPDIHIGNTYITLAIGQKDARYSANDFHTYQQMRIGYMDEASKKAIERFATMNAFSIETISFSSMEVMKQAVISGDIDAIASRDFVVDQNFRILNRFAAQPLGIAINRNKTSIYNQLDFALRSIQDINMLYPSNLYDTYFPISLDQTLILTQEEQDYLAALPPIRVVSGMNVIPLDYFEGSKFKGISADMLEEVAKQTGLQFDYQHVATTEDALALVQEGKADIVTGIYDDNNFLNDFHIINLAPLADLEMVILKNDDINAEDLKDKTIAIAKGYSWNLYADTIKAKYYNNIEDCILAVQKGEADFTYGNSYTVGYYVRKHALYDMEILHTQESTRSFTIGANKDMDMKLIAILNKAIQSIGVQQRNQIIYNNTYHAKYEISLFTFIHMHMMETLLAVVCLLSALFMYAIHRQRQKRVALRQKGLRYQMLADMSGDVFFEYDFKLDQLVLAPKSAQLIGVPPIVENFVKSVENNEFYFTKDEIWLLGEEELLQEDVDSYQRDFYFTLIDGRQHHYRALIMLQRDETKRLETCMGKLTLLDA